MWKKSIVVFLGLVALAGAFVGGLSLRPSESPPDIDGLYEAIREGSRVDDVDALAKAYRIRVRTLHLAGTFNLDELLAGSNLKSTDIGAAYWAEVTTKQHMFYSESVNVYVFFDKQGVVVFKKRAPFDLCW